MTGEEQSERQMPHNLDAERAVLGSMMLDGAVVADVMGTVKAEDFYLNAHKIIFRRMMELAHDGKPLDLTLMSDAFRKHGEMDAVGGYVYLAGMVEFVLYSGAAVENAKIVAEKAALRRVAESARRIMDAALSEKSDAATVASTGHEMLFASVGQTAKSRARSLSEAVPEVLSELSEHVRLRRQGARMGISWHLDEIDNATGGLRIGELTCLAAKPALGKTVLAMETVRVNAPLGVGAAVFSLEMSTPQLLARYFSAGTGVDYSRIHEANLTDREMDSITAYATKLMDFGIEIDDSSHLTAAEIRMRVRMMKARNPKLQLVVIDSLGLMNHGSERGSTRAQLVGETMKSLMAMAKDPALGVAVLLIHHLTRGDAREGDDREPSMSQLRDSGEIEQWCHNIAFLHPFGAWNGSQRVLEFIAPKQRFLGPRRAKLTLDGAHQRFEPYQFFHSI